MTTTPIGLLSTADKLEIKSSTPSALETKGIPAYIRKLQFQLERERDPIEVRHIQGGLKVLRELDAIREELRNNKLTTS